MEKAVKKDDLINALRETGLPKVEAEKALNVLIGTVGDFLAKGEKVRITHLGSFYVRTRKKGTVVTPDGKKVKVPARKVVHFKPFKSLKEKVNTKNNKHKKH